MKIRIAIAAVAVLASLAGCSSGGDSPEAGARPEGGASSASPTPRVYDVHDCRAVLERDYDADTLHDASAEPECAHLAHGEYLEVVKQVLTGRKDEILEDSAQHVEWDEAWDGTAKDQQDLVCQRLIEDGVEAVGGEMIEAAGDESSGDEVEMSQYIFDEKC